MYSYKLIFISVDLNCNNNKNLYMNCINSIMSPIIQSTQEYMLIFPHMEFPLL